MKKQKFCSQWITQFRKKNIKDSSYQCRIILKNNNLLEMKITEYYISVPVKTTIIWFTDALFCLEIGTSVLLFMTSSEMLGIIVHV